LVCGFTQAACDGLRGAEPRVEKTSNEAAVEGAARQSATNGEEPPRYQPSREALATLLRAGFDDWYGVFNEQADFHGSTRKVGWYRERLRSTKLDGRDVYEYSETYHFQGTYYEAPRTIVTEITQIFAGKAPYELLSVEETYADRTFRTGGSLRRTEKDFAGTVREGNETRTIRLALTDYNLLDPVATLLRAREKSPQPPTVRCLVRPQEGETETSYLMIARPDAAGGRQLEIRSATRGTLANYEFAADGTCRMCEIIGDYTYRRTTEADAKAEVGNYRFPETGSLSRTGPPEPKGMLAHYQVEIPGDWRTLIKPSDLQAVSFDAERKVTVVDVRSLGRRDFPVTPEDRETYLTKAGGIPNSVRMKSEELSHGCKTDLEKVVRFVAYLHRTLHYRTNYDPPTSVDVLQTKLGDCSEYSVLLEQLCRAAGMPARYVGGLVPDGDTEFGLHAWNEVGIDGQWHSIDATWGRITADAGRVRIRTFPDQVDPGVYAAFHALEKPIHVTKCEVDVEGWSKHYVDWIRRFPNEPLMEYAYATNLRETDAKKAIERLTRVIEADPAYAAAWDERGYCHAQLKDHEAALADMRKAVEISGDDPDRLQNVVDMLILLDRYGDAVVTGTKVIELAPHSAAAWGRRGLAYLYFEQYEKCLTDFRKAAELEPKSATYRGYVGQALYRLRRFGEAARQLTEAIELDQNADGAWYFRGMCHSNLDNSEAALSDVRKAAELDPDDAVYAFQLGTMLMGLQKYREAAEALNKGTKLYEEYDAGHFYLGLCYGYLDQHEESRKSFARAAELDPKDALYRMSLGGALVSLGRYEEAIQSLTRAIELNPESADALRDRAGAYRRSGKLSEALADCEKALMLAPNDELAGLEHVQVLIAMGRHADAIAAATRVIKTTGGSSALAFGARADAREAAGDAKGAKQDRAERDKLLRALDGTKK
jgi:tetratricopeptide (TPR) repeat protein/transglutaminase-like putative cysteine protease